MNTDENSHSSNGMSKCEGVVGICEVNLRYLSRAVLRLKLNCASPNHEGVTGVSPPQHNNHYRKKVTGAKMASDLLLHLATNSQDHLKIHHCECEDDETYVTTAFHSSTCLYSLFHSSW